MKAKKNATQNKAYIEFLAFQKLSGNEIISILRSFLYKSEDRLKYNMDILNERLFARKRTGLPY